MTTDSLNDNVKVCVRTRACLGGEVNKKNCLTSLQGQNAVLLQSKPDPKLFTFDYVADESTSQEQIFDQIARPIIDAHIDGYNGCIFAYGQTGSGKSYTIVGAEESGGVLTSDLRGLIPRTFQYLFDHLNDHHIDSYKCTLSFLELYNENIIDLLDHTQTNLSIREDIKIGVYVEGLKEVEINSPESAMELLRIGTNNRHVAATAMNSSSSRSHSVLTLNLESTTKTEDGLTKTRYSKLRLIDLAGSERQKCTEAAGTRLKEAGSINKSLSVLGNVIRSLVEIANGKPRHVQYRDSKLTFLLKDSLGGNSKTYIIATVSPSDMYHSETLSTLQFAQRAKHVRNIAIVNEEASGNVTLLQMENKRLKEEIYRMQQNGVAAAATAPIDVLPGYPMLQMVDPAAHSFALRNYDLQVLHSTAIDRANKFKEERDMLFNRLRHYKLLIEKKDHFLQSTRFVLKLREETITRLSGKSSLTTYEEDLKEEIAELKKQVAFHPDITKIAIENVELKEIIKERENPDEQLAALKQQIHDLQQEVRILYGEKSELYQQLETISKHPQSQPQQPNKTPIKQIPSTPSTPLVERQKYKELLDNYQLQWEKEKKEIEQQYQSLHQKNIRLFSEYETIKAMHDESEQSLHNLHTTHEKEIEKINSSNDNFVRILKNAHTLQIEQYNKDNSDNNQESNELIKELTVNIEKLENNNNELSSERIKLISELFEKNEQVNQLKIDLESTKLSNQRMSEVFISTPLRSQIKQDGEVEEMKEQEIEEKGPIKFNLPKEEQESIILEKNTMIEQLQNQLEMSKTQLQVYQDELENKDQIIQQFENTNNELLEEKEVLMNEIETLNQNQNTSSLEDDGKNNNNNNGILDIQEIINSKEVQLILNEKQEQLDKLVTIQNENDQTIKSLKQEIKEQNENIINISSQYQQETIDLSSRLSTISETIQKKEQEALDTQKEREMEILNLKSTMSEEFETKQHKLVDSIKVEYERNISLLKGEIEKAVSQHQQLRQQESGWAEKYKELKVDYDQMVDQLETYHTRIAEQYDEIFHLKDKLRSNNNNNNNDYYSSNSNSFSKPKTTIREEDIIIISSDEEEDDDEDKVYRPSPSSLAYHNDPSNSNIDDIDFSKIIVKKEQGDESYQSDDDYDMQQQQEEEELNLSELGNNNNNNSYQQQQQKKVDESKRSSIATNDDDDDQDDEMSGDNAIMSNLSIISQLGELERSFHGNKMNNNNNNNTSTSSSNRSTSFDK
ncbi:putative kinesin-14 [Cavenderia fasciculata]|uniref:Kinesin-14 n=1 Tax=Cavenderia fasciculata TaxID=261658 RepID=F4PYG6_CACFS|nr:putative kinesin-14 [Cavenderia fasciculata]EGG19232.1 putative kinesin-14 [Cavenderia fasciculata]|eukprot:XP_004357503.1 putative kinesin-14 [Cavenderia fasciculata]